MMNESMKARGYASVGLSTDWVNDAWRLARASYNDAELVVFENDDYTYSILYTESLPDDVAVNLGSEGAIVELATGQSERDILATLAPSSILAWALCGHDIIRDRIAEARK
jgi:hypothetical protein